MAPTAVATAVAFKQFMEFLPKARPISFDLAAYTALADLTLPFYLDLRYPCPIMSICVNDAGTEHYTYALYNAAGASDQVLLTAVLADQPGAGQFMIGNGAGANPGNVILLGDTTLKTDLVTINAIWEGIDPPVEDDED
jgi:hypothetical protein